MDNYYVIYKAFCFVNSIFGEFVQILFHFLWSYFVVFSLFNCMLCILNGELILNRIVCNAAGCWYQVKGREKKTSSAFYWMTQLFSIWFGKTNPQRQILEISYFLTTTKKYSQNGRLFQVNHVKMPWIFQINEWIKSLCEWAELIFVQKWQTVVVSFFSFSFHGMICFAYHLGVSSFQLYFASCVLCHINWLNIYLIEVCWVLIALFYVRIVQFYFFSYSQTWCNHRMECARDLSLVTTILILFRFIFISSTENSKIYYGNSSSICHCSFDCLCFFVEKKETNKNEIQPSWWFWRVPFRRSICLHFWFIHPYLFLLSTPCIVIRIKYQTGCVRCISFTYFIFINPNQT